MSPGELAAVWEAYGLEMDDELIGELSEAEADAVLGMSVMVLGDEQLQLRPDVTSFESIFDRLPVIGTGNRLSVVYCSDLT